MKKFLTTVFAAAAFATPLAGAMYENEFPFIIREPAADSVVNVSFLNHKPAGKHGVLRAVGGNFVFEDGTPVRWFGLNVVDNRVFNMYAPETAKTVARKMAALGINIVRIHHMTAGWQNAAPFFKDRAESTLEFNDRALELLDRFTAALKEEGIYVTCELPDSSLEPALSEIPNGTREGFDLKLLMLFDPEVQAYVKKYVRAFFMRPNRYTGRSLFEDPQFVMLGVVNEVAYNYHPKGLAGLNPYYTGKLRPKFREYLKRNRLPERELDLSLNDDASAKFWNETMAEGYRMWRDYVRSLGYRGVISGSNVGENFYHTQPSLAGDFMDAHLYWGYAPWSEGNVRILSGGRWSPLLKKPVNESREKEKYTKDLFARFSLASVAGKPLISSEHRTAKGGATASLGANPMQYNEYRAAGLPFFSAVHAFQEWDGFYLFASQGTEQLNQYERMGHILDVRHDTTYLATFPLSAWLLRGGAVAPARQRVLLKVSEKDILSTKKSPSFFSDLLFNTPERHRLELAYPGTAYRPEDYAQVFDYASSCDRKLDDIGPVIESDTGEFRRNWEEGYWVLDTPSAQGAEGFFDRTRRFELNDMTLEMESPFGVCFLASFGEEEIAGAKRMMFLAAGECGNTLAPGTDPAPNGWWLKGGSPVVQKPVAGTLRLKSGRCDVWILGEHGERKTKAAEKTDCFRFDTGRDRTVWYELAR